MEGLAAVRDVRVAGAPQFAALVLEQRALSPSRAGLEAGHGVVRGEVSRRDRDREQRLGALDHVAEATDRPGPRPRETPLAKEKSTWRPPFDGRRARST